MRDYFKTFLNQDRDYFEDRSKREIEQNRKAIFKIKFSSKNNEPIENTDVSITQTKLDFNIGANVFMLDQYEDSDTNEFYKKEFLKVFNTAVVPLYWANTEPEKGHYRYDKTSNFMRRRPPADQVVEFCEEKGLKMKGHPIFWHEFLPDWIPTNYDELKPLIFKRIDEIAKRYADKIDMFDVVNEPSRIWDCYKRDRAKCNSIIPGDNYLNEIFNYCSQLFPANQLFINDAIPACFYDFRGKYSGYYLNIKDLLSQGVRIDAIGLQCHVWKAEGCENVLNPRYLYEVLDTYASLGKPIHISEIGFASKFKGIDDEDLQALFLETLYKAVFSHKNGSGIIWWNLTDDGVYGAQRGTENMPTSGLIDYDYNEKKSYKVLNKLVNEEWKTIENSHISNGEVSFKGFYGEYDITVKGKVHHIKFNKNDLKEQIIIL